MTTSTITAEAAVKAFSMISLPNTNQKVYEATFEMKELPEDVLFRLQVEANERVNSAIEMAEKFRTAEDLESIKANASNLFVQRYNELVWSYKYDNKSVKTFVASNKAEAEKIARVYASKVLENQRLVYVYVKR